MPLTAAQAKVYQFVLENFEVDGEVGKRVDIYGPISGDSFEMRVIHAAENGKLQVKAGKQRRVEEANICFECGENGHVRRFCPSAW